MLISHLSLKDFRSYEAAEVRFREGTCVVLGANGIGKSNLLEAVSYAAQLESFRNAPTDALIRRSAASAIVRADFLSDGRDCLLEAEITRSGRNRVLLNRQRLARTADLSAQVLVTVFAPGDLELIKGGPALRRSFLDQLLVSLRPRNDAVRAEFEKSLKQRNALLKQVRGDLDESAAVTLDVWDDKLSRSGSALAELRVELIDRLRPVVQQAYRDVARTDADVGLEYEATWRRAGLAQSLVSSRREDLRRGVTLVGPHRDELGVSLNSMPARTHASQGEQRTLALALRLASHRLLTASRGTAPILLLDDVFSELDDARSAALLDSLPEGQRILTTATEPSGRVKADQILVVDSEGITERSL